MQTLKAFKFISTVVIAAESPEQAWNLLLAEQPSQHFLNALKDSLCSEAELDEPKAYKWGEAAPTLREQLSHAVTPCFLSEAPPAGWKVCSPELLRSGVNCHTAPRWAEGPIGQHWHPPVSDD
ncbi:hypothetical protein [Pseudomonas sp. PGPR81]|uniref:hypothetical protein n=1 Tax=Pseudomonas sp. PGPR81 TaxID=2913477 RepID=UPI001EDAB571|nr:hypothetical protein [Pseudomonas sp. PGPR81]